MKVKLVFEKSFAEQRGLSRNCFSETIEVNLPDGFDMAHLIAARCYNPLGHSSQSPTTSDMVATVIEYEDDNRLVGKLLTYIDATYTDVEQRKAHKDLVKDLVYGFTQDLRTRAYQTIESQK